MAKSPLDQFTDAERLMLTRLAETRMLLLALRTPRALECVRAIEDVGKEITGDDRFFHTNMHKIP
jgi:antitoxin component of RelBE/YafQ-DinJ toxin-antitoxin module